MRESAITIQFPQIVGCCNMNRYDLHECWYPQRDAEVDAVGTYAHVRCVKRSPIGTFEVASGAFRSAFMVELIYQRRTNFKLTSCWTEKLMVIDGMRFMEKLFERIISTRLNRLRVVSTRLIRYFRWLDTLEEATLGTQPKIQRSSGGNPRADRLDRGPIRTVQSCTRGAASAPSKSQTSRSPEARAVCTLGSPLEII